VGSAAEPFARPSTLPKAHHLLRYDLRYDFNYSARSGIDEHRGLVNNCILVAARQTVFRRNRAQRNAFSRQYIANDDVRMVRPSIRRNILLDDIVMKPRTLRAGQAANDAGRRIKGRPDNRATTNKALFSSDRK
jgi:hypothetical protein